MFPATRIAPLLTVMLCLQGAAFADEPAFRLHTIDATSTYSAAAAIDVNRDGKLDVVCGGWWYEAPLWKRHFLRDVRVIRGRYDDYAHLPMDVNGDGWTDYVSANWRSQTLYWVQHPGPSLGAWTKHLIATPGGMETARLVDVDGDGHVDVLPNCVRTPSGQPFAAWWELRRASNDQPGRWIRHDLPAELAGHGIGFGDLNGDGRDDLIGTQGWLEAPLDRRRERWRWHSDFQLDRDCSIPILVHDVDDDGDADLVWGRAHHIGLYWLEQRVQDNRIRWVRHAIDTSWSQAHSLLLADLDNDGTVEIVAGKRYLGHEGNDPGEYDPLVAYWYRFDAQQRTWKRGAVSAGGPAGFGLDPKAVDLDGDGDLDLLGPGRSGVYWFENLFLGKGQAAPPPTAWKYENHAHLQVFRNERGVPQPITTPHEWAQRRQHILAGMERAMGPLPSTTQRVPLAMQIHETKPLSGYRRHKISFASEPGDRVPAFLLIPNDVKQRRPAMLCLHQTTAIGKGEPAGLGGRDTLHYAHELANRGYVCLVPDYPSFGDYPYDFQEQGDHYASGSMKAIWNNLRAVDLLQTIPEVDRDRIGCIGHSLGGHNALFTAVFDQRLRVIVTSCGFTAFHHYYNGKLAGWTSPRYMPRIAQQYDNNPDRVPFDFHEVIAALAPRPVFINAPTRDSNFAVEGVRQVVNQASLIYRLRGAADALRAEYPKSAHDFPDAIREAVYQWLEENL
ncbi:MAG: hypothetical protein CMJ75_01310 [Planctomycetaceae bacterium]|nr:hypothetical protein [Planctomycetaceae bacterium]